MRKHMMIHLGMDETYPEILEIVDGRLPHQEPLFAVYIEGGTIYGTRAQLLEFAQVIINGLQPEE